MKRNFRSPGIILRSRKSGEKNKLLDILTPQRGIIVAMAYGAASPKSKLKSVTQAYSAGEMQFYEDPVKGFIKVSEIDIEYDFAELRLDMKAIYAAGLLVEVLLQVYAGGGGDPEPYRLTFEYLSNLSMYPQKVIRLANIALWRCMEIIGEQPNLESDVFTDHPIPPASTLYYHFYDRGFSTRAGTSQVHSAWQLQGGELGFLRNESRRTMKENADVSLPDGADNRLFHMLTKIFEFNLQRPLRCLKAGFLP